MAAVPRKHGNRNDFASIVKPGDDQRAAVFNIDPGLWPRRRPVDDQKWLPASADRSDEICGHQLAQALQQVRVRRCPYGYPERTLGSEAQAQPAQIERPKR